jgi:cytochrome c556
MANYVLVYKGGGGMAEDEAARQQIMEAWGRWFGSLGESLVDGGNPFGSSAVVASNGSVSNSATSALTGYSIIKGDSLQAATEAAKGCPVLSSGGSIEVYETFPVM